MAVSVKVQGKQRGMLAAPEVEALEAARTVADRWGVASVRPCVASIYVDGASKGDGRQPYAHLLAMEMLSLGVPVDRIGELLRSWNMEVVSPPLADSEIRKVTRRLERPGLWPYGCKNPKLAVYCLGETCPHVTNNARWEGCRVSPNGLTESGWPQIMSGADVKVFLGLYRLARLKGSGPKASIRFTFAELERNSGVKRGHLREILEQLLHKGLIVEVHFSSEKGKVSTFRFPPVLPPTEPSLISRGK